MKEKINILLMALLGSETLVDKWWKSPNKAFDLKTPDEIYQQPDGPNLVFKYVYHAAYGDSY